jgi:hypothetical protein
MPDWQNAGGFPAPGFTISGDTTDTEKAETAGYSGNRSIRQPKAVLVAKLLKHRVLTQNGPVYRHLRE